MTRCIRPSGSRLTSSTLTFINVDLTKRRAEARAARRFAATNDPLGRSDLVGSKPQYCAWLADDSDSTIITTNSNRHDRFRRMDTLEVKARIPWIDTEEQISGSRSLVHAHSAESQQLPITQNQFATSKLSRSSGSVMPASSSRIAAAAISERRSCEQSVPPTL